MSFVHLHAHTAQGSLLDSILTRDELILHHLGQDAPAVAITEHGTLFNATKFAADAQTFGLKPIMGLEAYVVRDRDVRERGYWHMTLLAQNEAGWRNLQWLVSDSYKNGFYYRPRIGYEQLREHSEGIICLTGCLGGVFNRWALEDPSTSDKDIEFFLELYEGRIYVEIMDTGIAQQRQACRMLIDTAESWGIKPVITGDVHYTKCDDEEIHDLALCIRTKTNVNRKERFKFDGHGYYLKTRQQMEQLGFPQEFYDATLEIADRIESYPIGAQRIAKDQVDISDQARKGLFLAGLDTPRHRARLEEELSIISKLGYGRYFSEYSDIIQWAKEEGMLVGPGRGSAAASLVARAMGITAIDPLRFPHMLFARFLNESRESPPDIDMDFCRTDRGSVVGHMREMWGEENVQHISTFSTLGCKAAITDVARVLGVNYQTIKAYTTQFGQDHELSDLTVEQREWMDSVDKRWFPAVERVLGLPRHAGIHASGIVVKDDDEIWPLWKKVGSDEATVQYDMHELERMGYLKFDILGINALDKIHKCIRLIGVPFDGNPNDIWELPLTDKKTWRLIATGETDDCFQMGSESFKALARGLRPSTFPDLMALNALNRPVSAGTGWDKEYVKRHHGKSWRLPDPSLKRALKSTYGIMVYQEQIMFTAIDFAGYTSLEADYLRKVVGKKLVEKIKAEGKDFRRRAIERKGRDPKITADIWNMIKPAARYAFNAAHSASYSLVGYVTAYLKTHYPLQWLVAVLNTELGDPSFVAQCLSRNRDWVSITLPGINDIGMDFTIRPDPMKARAIQFGLRAIKGVGEKAATAILTERENGPFVDRGSLEKRIPAKQCNKRVKEILVKLGILPHKKISITRAARYRFEVEVLGLPVTVSGVMERENLMTGGLKQFDGQPPLWAGDACCRVLAMDPHKTRKGHEMAFLSLMDGFRVREAVIFPDNWKKAKKTLVEGLEFRLRLSVTKRGTLEILRGKRLAA